MQNTNQQDRYPSPVYDGYNSYPTPDDPTWAATPYGQAREATALTTQREDTPPRESWRPPPVYVSPRAPRQPTPDVQMTTSSLLRMTTPEEPNPETPLRLGWRPPPVTVPTRAPRQPTPDIELTPTPAPSEETLDHLNLDPSITEVLSPPTSQRAQGGENSPTGNSLNSDRSQERREGTPLREDWWPPKVIAPHRAPKQPTPDITMSPIPPPRTPRKATPPRKTWRPPRVEAPHRAPRQPTPDIHLPPLSPSPLPRAETFVERNSPTHSPVRQHEESQYSQHHDVTAFDVTASTVLYSPKSHKNKHGPVYDPKQVESKRVLDPRTTIRAIARLHAARARVALAKKAAQSRRASEEVPPLNLPKSPSDETHPVLVSQSPPLSPLSEELSPKSSVYEFPMDGGKKLPKPGSPSPRVESKAPSFGSSVGSIQRSLQIFS
ncbi:uncharacterized protein [Littorina saxatilis]|uniref:Uncharacterized protein n=1 Tax=Littorina saxatilis TaxID=31220 RepID=A0AAN9G258_9CAEN